MTKPAGVADANDPPVLHNAIALAENIRAVAGEIESGRRLPETLFRELKEAGIFGMAMPRSWGGPELDPLIPRARRGQAPALGVHALRVQEHHVAPLGRAVQVGEHRRLFAEIGQNTLDGPIVHPHHAPLGGDSLVVPRLDLGLS